MAQWKFQLCPNEKDVIGIGYRMDTVGQAVENEINDALRYPFKFHRVNKIVVMLGKSPVNSTDYSEVGGVGTKQYPAFDAHQYMALNDAQRRDCLVAIAQSVFQWLIENFDDADFAVAAADRLNWNLSL